MKTNNLYPIKAVSVKTGLTIHVIRAWEKRYQAVTPVRTETNRRLYSEQDIEKLILLKQAIAEGQNIGNIASLETAEIKNFISSHPKPSAEMENNSIQFNDDGAYYLAECISTIKQFNAQAFEKMLITASFQMGQTNFLEFVVFPLIKAVGDLWHGGKIRIMHEHMATAVLTSFLTGMRNNYRPEPGAPSIIVTTPTGQHHELGALILSLVSASEGWNVTYLGPNLPAEEIAVAAKKENAKVIVLSIVYPADDHYLKQDLLKLNSIVPENIKIMAGGRLANNYKTELESINALVINNLLEFRKISNHFKQQVIDNKNN